MKSIRRIIIAAFIACAALTASAKGIDVKNELTGLAKEFDGKDEVNVVKLGKMAMSIARIAVDKEAGRAIKNIEQMLVIEYEDASDGVIREFESKLNSILKKTDLIMEAKEDGETVRIYGKPDGQKIRDIIIHTPDECALVCLFGSISLNDLDDVVKDHKK